MSFSETSSTPNFPVDDRPRAAERDVDLLRIDYLSVLNNSELVGAGLQAVETEGAIGGRRFGPGYAAFQVNNLHNRARIGTGNVATDAATCLLSIC